MASENVENKVKEIICAQLDVPPDKVTPEARFAEDLKADSLAVVELVLALEEAFDMKIEDEEAEQIKTVRDAVTYIETHMKKSS
jgi:acyl carrier protein